MTALLSMPRSRTQTALSTSSQPELRQLSTIESDDAIHITGRVSCFYMKQMAFETVKHVSGDCRVFCSVEVDEWLV